MSTARALVRTLTAALGLPRLPVALALAVALVAIPTVRPNEASARRMSEGNAVRLCVAPGGSMYYNFSPAEPSFLGDSYDMTSTLPSGALFTCYAVVTIGDTVTCY